MQDYMEEFTKISSELEARRAKCEEPALNFCNYLGIVARGNEVQFKEGELGEPAKE